MKRVLLIVVLTTILFLGSISPVLAATPPDSGPFILSVNMYRHYLEDDDMLMVVKYNIPYAATPDEIVTNTFIGRFLTGAIELGRALPYAFQDKGYGFGIYSIYLDESDAPVWEGAYTAELSGNPTLAWGGPIPLVSTNSLTWNDTDTHSATQALVRAYILTLGVDLNNEWSLSPLSLLTQLATGTVLSSLGETYFVNAMSQLRGAVPELFQERLETITWDDYDPPLTLIEQTEANWPLDLSGISDWIGLPSQDILTAIIFFLVVALVAFQLGSRTRPEYGIFTILVFLPLAGLLGVVSLMWAVMVAFAFIFVVGLIIFIQKTGS